MTRRARRAGDVVGGDGVRPDPGDGGYSVVEAVVSVLLLAVLAVGVEASVLGTMKLTAESQRRVAATHLASREIDLVREALDSGPAGVAEILGAGTVVNPNPLAGGVAGDPLVVQGVGYTVTRDVHYRTVVGGVSVCDLSGTPLGSELLAEVVVEVTWPERRAAAPVRVVEVMATQDGSAAMTHSYIAVKVTDGGGPPQPVVSGRVAVVDAVTNASVAVAATDATGCAVVPVTPAASGTSYDVLVSKDGHVSPGWAAVPRTVVGLLTADEVVHGVTSTLARAGTLRFTLVHDDLTPLTKADLETLRAALSAESPWIVPLAYLTATSGLASEGEVVTPLPEKTPTWDVTGVWPSVYSAWLGEHPPSPLGQVEVTPGAVVDVLLSATLGIVGTGAPVTPPPPPPPSPPETSEPAVPPAGPTTEPPTTPPTAPPTTEPSSAEPSPTAEPPGAQP